MLDPPRGAWRLLALFALVPLGVAFVSALLSVNPEFLFSDQAGIAQLPPQPGVFSFLGVLAWWSTATLCLAAALLAPRDPDAWLLASAVALTATLAFDDLFMVHEPVMPWFGVPEEVMLAAYAAAGLAHLALLRAANLRLDWPLLAAAAGLMGFSTAVDVLLPCCAMALVIEEGTKFAGMMAWAGYPLRAAGGALRRALSADGAPRG